MLGYFFLIIIGSYLLGTFPYMILLARARGLDFSREEDLHLATWSKIGRLEGLSAVVLDILKGTIPVMVGVLIQFPVHIVMISGLAAVMGQMWPFFRRFDGEKGNTTGLGIFVGVSIMYGLPQFFLLAVIPLACGFIVRTIRRAAVKEQTMRNRLRMTGLPSNALPIGMLLSFAVMPLIIWWLGQPLSMTLSFVALFLLIVIRRLTADLSDDLKQPKAGVARILFNRFLLDRSYW